MNHRTFLYTEEVFGFGQDSVLSEEDLLSMTSQAQNSLQILHQVPGV